MSHRKVVCPNCNHSDTVGGPGTYECSKCHKHFSVTEAMFATTGVIIGALVGGPIGAVVGGAVGYVWGSLFDD